MMAIDVAPLVAVPGFHSCSPHFPPVGTTVMCDPDWFQTPSVFRYTSTERRVIEPDDPSATDL